VHSYGTRIQISIYIRKRIYGTTQFYQTHTAVQGAVQNKKIYITVSDPNKNPNKYVIPKKNIRNNAILPNEHSRTRAVQNKTFLFKDNSPFKKHLIRELSHIRSPKQGLTTNHALPINVQCLIRIYRITSSTK
jgi:hypothetical protein